MSSERLTKTEFQAAIKVLEKDNKEITILNLREIIGHGSYSTLSKMLKEYKDTQDEKNLMPEVFKSKINELSEKLYNYLSSDFNTKLNETLKKYDSKIKELDNAIITLNKAKFDIENENKKLKIANDILEKENMQLKAKNDSLQDEVKHYKNSIISSEQIQQLANLIINAKNKTDQSTDKKKTQTQTQKSTKKDFTDKELTDFLNK